RVPLVNGVVEVVVPTVADLGPVGMDVPAGVVAVAALISRGQGAAAEAGGVSIVVPVGAAAVGILGIAGTVAVVVLPVPAHLGHRTLLPLATQALAAALPQAPRTDSRLSGITGRVVLIVAILGRVCAARRAVGEETGNGQGQRGPT